MKKATRIVLMPCFILSGAFCFVHGEAETIKKRDEVAICLIANSTCSSPSKGSSIIPTLNGHILTIVFSENIGQVSVEVDTLAGASVESLSVYTPNCVQVYIPNAGNYIVTFTLSNGDVYYGEFTVTD